VLIDIPPISQNKRPHEVVALVLLCYRYSHTARWRGGLVDMDKAEKIQRVLNDQQSVTLVEAVELRVEALRLGIECEVAESPVWGDFTLIPKP